MEVGQNVQKKVIHNQAGAVPETLTGSDNIAGSQNYQFFAVANGKHNDSSHCNKKYFRRYSHDMHNLKG
jgi:hypothetical protein